MSKYLSSSLSPLLTLIFDKRDRLFTKDEYSNYKNQFELLKDELGFNPIFEKKEFLCLECETINLVDDSSDLLVCSFCSEQFDEKELNMISSYFIPNQKFDDLEKYVYNSFLSLIKGWGYEESIVEGKKVLKFDRNFINVLILEKASLEKIIPILYDNPDSVIIISWRTPSREVIELINIVFRSILLINLVEAITENYSLENKLNYLKKKKISISGPRANHFKNSNNKKIKLLPFYLKIIPISPINELIDSMNYYINNNEPKTNFFGKLLSKKEFTEIWVHLWFILFTEDAIPLSDYLFDSPAPNPPAADGIFSLPDPLNPTKSIVFMYDVTNLNQQGIHEDVNQSYRYLVSDFPEKKYAYYYIFHFTSLSDQVQMKYVTHYNELMKDTSISTQLVFMNVKILLKILEELNSEGLSPYILKKKLVVFSKYLFSRLNNPKVTVARDRKNYPFFTVREEEISYLIEKLKQNLEEDKNFQKKKFTSIGYGPKDN